MTPKELIEDEEFSFLMGCYNSVCNFLNRLRKHCFCRQCETCLGNDMCTFSGIAVINQVLCIETDEYRSPTELLDLACRALRRLQAIVAFKSVKTAA